MQNYWGIREARLSWKTTEEWSLCSRPHRALWPLNHFLDWMKPERKCPMGRHWGGGGQPHNTCRCLSPREDFKKAWKARKKDELLHPEHNMRFGHDSLLGKTSESWFQGQTGPPLRKGLGKKMTTWSFNQKWIFNQIQYKTNGSKSAFSLE